MCRITLLFLPLSKSLKSKPCLPHLMLPVRSFKFIKSRYNIVFWGKGEKGQLNKSKRDKVEAIGGWKDQSVNNFVADCRFSFFCIRAVERTALFPLCDALPRSKEKKYLCRRFKLSWCWIFQVGSCGRRIGLHPQASRSAVNFSCAHASGEGFSKLAPKINTTDKNPYVFFG